jgi:hypothetical protein
MTDQCDMTPENGSVNAFPPQEYTCNNRRTERCGVYYAVRVEANPQFVVKVKQEVGSSHHSSYLWFVTRRRLVSTYETARCFIRQFKFCLKRLLSSINLVLFVLIPFGTGGFRTVGLLKMQAHSTERVQLSRIESYPLSSGWGRPFAFHRILVSICHPAWVKSSAIDVLIS